MSDILESENFDIFEEERKITTEITDDYEVDLDFEYSQGDDLDFVKKDFDWTGPLSACYTGISEEKAIEVIVAFTQREVTRYVIKVIATTIDGVKRYELDYPTFKMAYRALIFLTNHDEEMGCDFQINNDHFNISLGSII